MELVTASLILSATLMMLWGATALLLMTSNKPLVNVTVITPPVRLLFNQHIHNAYFRSASDGSNGMSYGAT